MGKYVLTAASGCEVPRGTGQRPVLDTTLLPQSSQPLSAVIVTVGLMLPPVLGQKPPKEGAVCEGLPHPSPWGQLCFFILQGCALWCGPSLPRVLAHEVIDGSSWTLARS